MVKSKPLKRHDLTTNRPQKMPVLSDAELEFYDQQTLDSLLFFRRLGYNLTPPKGFPDPPNPQFEDLD